MGFTDNFGHPKGLLGRMMLSSMDKEHLPMAEWSFTQFEIPEKADIMDLGCGGGFNIRRMMKKCKEGKIVGYDISEESVKKARSARKIICFVLKDISDIKNVAGEFRRKETETDCLCQSLPLSSVSFFL